MPESSSPPPTTLEAVLARFGQMEETLELKTGQFAEELARKDEIIEGLQRRLYGSKSERLDPNQEILEFTDELMGKPEAPIGENGPALSEDDEGEGGDCEKPKRKRRSKQDRFPRNLAAIVKNVLIPEEVQLDSDAYREIGEEHHDEISCTRSELYWERTVRKKFVRKEDRAQPPVIPPAPEPSVPGTMCAAALMARILCDKYLDHLPHYRQATRIERRYDAEISRQTLNKWTHAAADFLSPIADAILAEIQLVGCLAHIRRKFYEAREQVPEVVMPILPSIQRLYRIEENLRQSGAPPGCRELVRRSKSRPIVNELQKKITAELGVHLPKSNPGKALRYALGQWSGFARYMKDGRLEIDNNLVENAIRPTKLGAEKQR